jgi:hypothetical protein
MMSDTTIERNEYQTLSTEISDEALEAAGSPGYFVAYTQFAYCTQFACPGLPKLDFSQQKE